MNVQLDYQLIVFIEKAGDTLMHGGDRTWWTIHRASTKEDEPINKTTQGV